MFAKKEGNIMEKYFVEIKKFKASKIIKRIECETERDAEQIERGVNINLNHGEYYTVIKIERE